MIQSVNLLAVPTIPRHELGSPTASTVERQMSWREHGAGDSWKGAGTGTTSGCPQSRGWTVGPTLPCPRTGVLSPCTPPPRRTGSTPNRASLGLHQADCPPESQVTRRTEHVCLRPTGAPAAVAVAEAAAQATAQPPPGAPLPAVASCLTARAKPRSMDQRHRNGAASHGDLSLGDAGLDWEGARPHPGMDTRSWPAPPSLKPQVQSPGSPAAAPEEGLCHGPCAQTVWSAEAKGSWSPSGIRRNPEPSGTCVGQEKT